MNLTITSDFQVLSDWRHVYLGDNRAMFQVLREHVVSKSENKKMVPQKGRMSGKEKSWSELHALHSSVMLRPCFYQSGLFKPLQKMTSQRNFKIKISLLCFKSDLGGVFLKLDHVYLFVIIYFCLFLQYEHFVSWVICFSFLCLYINWDNMGMTSHTDKDITGSWSFSVCFSCFIHFPQKDSNI